jgi:hypothetical protein
MSKNDTEDFPEEVGGIKVLPVLEQIDKNRKLWESTDSREGAYWGTWFRGDYCNSVLHAMPEGTSDLRARAFMKIIGLKHGLITGCHCGCRGDYVLTYAGQAYLAIESALKGESK